MKDQQALDRQFNFPTYFSRNYTWKLLLTPHTTPDSCAILLLQSQGKYAKFPANCQIIIKIRNHMKIMELFSMGIN